MFKGKCVSARVFERTWSVVQGRGQKKSDIMAGGGFTLVFHITHRIPSQTVIMIVVSQLLTSSRKKT